LIFFNILKYNVGNARKIILSKTLINFKRFLDAFFNSFILESSACNLVLRNVCYNEVGDTLKTIYDVQQLLKKFGTIIYIGDRVSDLELMEEEMKQLYQSNLVEPKDYQMAVLLLRQEIQKLKKQE